MPSLITAIAADEVTREWLRWPCDFDLARAGRGDKNTHLRSGAALEDFAGDWTGGTFYLCGDGGEERPVLYADSRAARR